jgi:hypothetical protein
MRDRNFASQGGRWTARVAVFLAAALLALLAAAPALADIVAPFDAGAEGWQISQHQGGTLESPSWFSTDGNPGGYIQFTDTDPEGDDDGGFFIRSGAPFAGDRAYYYGDNLSFDLRTSGPALTPPIVFIFSGVNAALAVGDATPGTSWSSFTIPLFTSDWSAPSGRLTKADFKALLGNLSSIVILADYQTAPGETTDLDNVALRAFTGISVQPTLSLIYTQHAFRGTLSSTDELSCPVASQVVAIFKQRKGDDKIVGLVQADSSGDFVLQQPAKKGKFYAAIREFHTPAVHCLEAKSPIVTRG